MAKTWFYSKWWQSDRDNSWQFMTSLILLEHPIYLLSVPGRILMSVLDEASSHFSAGTKWPSSSSSRPRLVASWCPLSTCCKRKILEHPGCWDRVSIFPATSGDETDFSWFFYRLRFRRRPSNFAGACPHWDSWQMNFKTNPLVRFPELIWQLTWHPTAWRFWHRTFCL